MDPLGKVQGFLTYLEGLNPKRQGFVIVREMLIALVTMIIFNFLGEELFKLFEISEITVHLTSGIILFLVAIKILFPSTSEEEHKKDTTEEPFLVPLAIPMIASPALLATIMLFASAEQDPWKSFIAVIIAWIVSCLILLSSKTLLRTLSPSGLTACEKLMGMILVLLSIQRILAGVILFHAKAFAAT
ncbi:MAG: putative antibiotic transporter [Chlamydiia bacterium]|nr:putative antibiotic transporter [Chlamydiia bacterium]